MTINQSLPRYVYAYLLCQSINLTAAVISVAVAATVGNLISPSPLLATLPYGIQFLFVLLFTYPAALAMSKLGRKFIFFLGAISLIISGILGFNSLQYSSFSLLIGSHAFLGIFTACANYYRYAATDDLPSSLKSKALSLVVAGGVIAGVVGPSLTSSVKNIEGFALYSMCYGVLVLLAVINICLLLIIPKSKVNANKESTKMEVQSNDYDLSKEETNNAIIGIASAAIGYGLMNLLMIQSSLYMENMCISFDKTSKAIQWHVVAMFLPSFFSGYVITKFGHRLVMLFGFLLFVVAFSINQLGTSFEALTWALVFLGVGWNFTYIAGSALLAVSVEKSNSAKKWQGICDTMIAVLAMMGAFLPSVFLGTIGWKNTNIMSIVLCGLMLAIIVRNLLSSKNATLEEL